MNAKWKDDQGNAIPRRRRERRGRRAWNVELVGSERATTELLQNKTSDVLASDRRIPTNKGVRLQPQRDQLHLASARLVFRRLSKPREILRPTAFDERVLSKPYTIQLRSGTVDRDCTLERLLQDESLGKMVSQIAFLPSLPARYRHLITGLESDSHAMGEMGEWMDSDLAMSAKLLHLVNSSTFGLAEPVHCPKHAASLLGLNLIRPLVLLAGVLTQCEDPDLDGYSLDGSIRYSLTVAHLARNIMASETESSDRIEDAYVAGVMHDIGRLILAMNMSERYQQVIYAARNEQSTIWSKELAVLGTTHAELGAYVLGLLGFSNSVVEAVAFHHQPGKSRNQAVSPLTAVHAADLILNASTRMHPQEQSGDADYLKEVGVADRMDEWALMAAQPR